MRFLPVKYALLVVSLVLSCTFDSTYEGVIPSQVGEDLQDAGQTDTPGEPDTSTLEPGADDAGGCEPACTAPNTQCMLGVCVCAEGYHDGGGDSGECVDESECSEGYGIPDGETGCFAVESFCDGETQCTELIGWSDGACQYGNLDDETVCEGESDDPCTVGFECLSGLCEPIMPECSDTGTRPILLVHGINGSSDNYAVMVQHLIDAGWAEEDIYLFDAEDPSWGCNEDNAHAIQALVDSILADTCEPRIDLVAHSMGVVSTRHYLKFLGGSDVVNTYVTLGGMHHGEFWSCLKPDWIDVCVWNEICESGEFMTALNEDPAVPGELHVVSIYSTIDESMPAETSQLDGAENIVFDDVEHSGPNGLLERDDVFAEVLRVLQYPCW